MKWITREKARVDRIACPWLIRRFVDAAPEFLFVPAGEVLAVAAREGAIPFDVPGVELGHHGDRSMEDLLVRHDAQATTLLDRMEEAARKTMGARSVPQWLAESEHLTAPSYERSSS